MPELKEEPWPELISEIPVPAASSEVAHGMDASDSEFQPYLLLFFVVVLAAVCVQNLWLRRRNEGEAGEGGSKA